MQDNNLVMALLGAGIVFVLVIVVYNQWQIRKARRPEVYNPPAGEAPQGEGWADRHEPALGGQRDEIGRVEPRLEPGLAPRSSRSCCSELQPARTTSASSRRRLPELHTPTSPSRRRESCPT